MKKNSSRPPPQVVNTVLVAEWEEGDQKTGATRSEMPPGMSIPDPRENTLDLYAATPDPRIILENVPVGAQRMQHPMFFVSEVLQDAKEC